MPFDCSNLGHAGVVLGLVPFGGFGYTGELLCVMRLALLSVHEWHCQHVEC